MKLLHYSECAAQKSVTAGTILHRTLKSLVLWFRAKWTITNRKFGSNALGLKPISSGQLSDLSMRPISVASILTKNSLTTTCSGLRSEVHIPGAAFLYVHIEIPYPPCVVSTAVFKLNLTMMD